MIGCDHGTSYDQSGTPAHAAGDFFNFEPHSEVFALQNERHRRIFFILVSAQRVFYLPQAKRIAHNRFPKLADGKILPSNSKI